MEVVLTEQAQRLYKRLPPHMRKKVDRRLQLLSTDLKHPSLNVKKMGSLDRYEARLDWHYRMTFAIIQNHIYILTLGPHDEGLGKK